MTVYYVCYRYGISERWIVYSEMFDTLSELISAIESEIDKKVRIFQPIGIEDPIEWAVFSHIKFTDRNLLVRTWHGNDSDYYANGTKLFSFTDESFWYDSQYHQSL